MNWDVVIGLEIHTQLNTQTKIFCGCSTTFGAPANTQTCPVCQAHPGVLPVFNNAVLDKAVSAGLGLNCTINPFSKFDRKNYFYPDLPKAYQISQFDQPVASNGHIDICWQNDKNEPQQKTIRINRIHMEEDAGKLIHSDIPGTNESYVDLNRSGVPLLEIVSEPDISGPEETIAYIQSIRSILLYLDISDCNMEEGSLRCDANISLRPKGETRLGTKTELKNMNSFKSIKQALEYEIKRQKKLLEKNEKIIQETRLFDLVEGKTKSMRVKEESHDYRYFPEPDLSPITITQEYIKKIKEQLPELPQAKKTRFIDSYNITEYDADILTADKNLADYFETAVKTFSKEPKKICNWIIVEVLSVLNDRQIPISEFKVQANDIGALFQEIDSGTISGKIAKDVFKDMVETGNSPAEIIKTKGLKQVSDDNMIRNICLDIIKKNPDSVQQFKEGKNQVLGFFMGQLMKETKGQANPKIASKIFSELLKN